MKCDKLNDAKTQIQVEIYMYESMHTEHVCTLLLSTRQRKKAVHSRKHKLLRVEVNFAHFPLEVMTLKFH